MTPPIPDGAVRKAIVRRPTTTRTQAVALRKANESLEAKYTGQYVAYVDSWSGDELERVVVAAGTDWDDYQRQLHELTAECLARVEEDFVLDPEETLFMAGYGVLA
jgi:hypothetical protein